MSTFAEHSAWMTSMIEKYKDHKSDYYEILIGEYPWDEVYHHTLRPRMFVGLELVGSKLYLTKKYGQHIKEENFSSEKAEEAFKRTFDQIPPHGVEEDSLYDYQLGARWKEEGNVIVGHMTLQYVAKFVYFFRNGHAVLPKNKQHLKAAHTWAPALVAEEQEVEG